MIPNFTRSFKRFFKRSSCILPAADRRSNAGDTVVPCRVRRVAPDGFRGAVPLLPDPGVTEKRGRPVLANRLAGPRPYRARPPERARLEKDCELAPRSLVRDADFTVHWTAVCTNCAVFREYCALFTATNASVFDSNWPSNSGPRSSQQRSVSVGGARFRTGDGRQVRVKSLGF